MAEKKLIYWWQKLLHIVTVVVITMGILGIGGSRTPASYAMTISQPYIIASSTKTTLEPKALNITVHRNPDCSCCGGWIKHLKTQGFEVQDFSEPDIEAVKQKYQVPDNLTSCHTAIVNGYVIEGHVPANDIKRLLAEKPNVSGLSVPQMPVGTPGMEVGDKKDPFTVFSFNHENSVAVFNDYAI